MVNYASCANILMDAYVAFGEYEAAIEQLDRLLSTPSPLNSAALARVDPIWDPLRNDPRFQAVLAKYEN
jgi:serine/threonine-protein kinase